MRISYYSERRSNKSKKSARSKISGVAEIIKNEGLRGLAKGVRRYLCYHSLLGELRFNFYRLFGFRWVVREIQGSKMLLDLSQDNIISIHRNLFTFGVREPQSAEILKRELRKGMKVLDIGANIGYYALLESRIVGDEGWVYALEPSPRNFNILSYNVKANGYTNIGLHSIAVGDRKEEAWLRMAEASNLDCISLFKSENTFNVKMTTVDNFLTGRHVDFIRMDVEGFEYYIFKGMDRALQSDLSKIFIECHPKLIRNYGGDVKEIFQRLTDHGFKTKWVVKPFAPTPVKLRLKEVNGSSLRAPIKCNLSPILLLKTRYISEDMVSSVRLFFER